MDFMIYMAGHAPAFAPTPCASTNERLARDSIQRVSRALAPCAGTRRTACAGFKAEPAVRKHRALAPPKSLHVTQHKVSRAPTPCASTVRQHSPRSLRVTQSRVSRAPAPPSTWVVSGSCSANCVRRWDRSRAASSSRTPPPKARSLSCRGCTPRRGRKARLCDRAGRALP